ncbi:MAG: hypothetical protein ACYTEK_19860 [Planctomycetota bacterium]
MEKFIRGISAISGIIFIVLGLVIYFEVNLRGNIYIPYVCFGAGTTLLIWAIIKMLLSEETKTLTIKIWFWIGVTCTVAIVAYVLLKIFGLIDVLIYGGAGVLVTAIAVAVRLHETKCPNCGKRWVFGHRKSKREKKWFCAGIWVLHSCKNCGYERRKRIPWYRQ